MEQPAPSPRSQPRASKGNQALPRDRAASRRGAQSELDRKHKVWRLPGARTKNGHPHSVPLSPLALELIGKADSEQVFPSDTCDPSLAVSRIIYRAQQRFGIPHFTVHDLRRTAL